MVVLSSFYVYIFRAFLIFTILINIIGIIIVKLLLPKDKAVTYDLTFSVMLIIVCIIILIIYLNLVYVSLDQKKSILNVKTLRNQFIIQNTNIIKVERVFFVLCKITYKERDKKKTIFFLPRIREFFPLVNFQKRIENLLTIPSGNRSGENGN